MTRGEMLKISWKAYQEVHYKHPRMDHPILCLLIEIDFDEETMTLQPLFDERYMKKDFYAAIQNCTIPKKRLKVKTVNGKVVNDKKVQPFDGKLIRWNPYFKYENIDNSAS